MIVEYAWQDDELTLLSAHDTDPFARWEACQELASREILNLVSQYHAHQPLSVRPAFITVWRTLAQADHLDAAYQARLLTLPAEKALAERMTRLDPPTLANAREFLYITLGQALAPEWRALIKKHQTPDAYSPKPKLTGQRTLKNLALKILIMGESTLSERVKSAQSEALTQYESAHNMTDRLAALSCLVHYGDADVANQKLQEFYEKWQHDPLVIDKWFALQATAPATTVATVRQLMTHPAFTLRNPDRARALVFQFCLNHVRGLHAADGSGYRYWAEQVLALNTLNPETAARLARAMDNWSRCVPALRQLMRATLEEIHGQPDLSPNVAEIISKTLTLTGL